jgi:death on curing protein
VLEGLLGAVQQTFDGQLLFPTVLDVAVAYFYKINRQHPFENGNKRMCVLYADTFLTLNGVELTLPYQDMYVLATFIADEENHKTHTPEQLQELCREVIADYCKKKR